MKRSLPVLALTLLIILLDQASKQWLLFGVGMLARAPIRFNDWCALVMVWNHGISFGMLNHGSPTPPWILAAMAVVVSTVLARLALKTPVKWERTGYSLVMGGALGNAIDRLRFGAVADFFYFHLGNLGWPAFNVADAAICIGVGLLLIMMVKHPSKP